MAVNSARLLQFRNFKDLEVHFSPRLNLFLGKNGIGKTSLLEALYVMAYGRSFRTSTLQSLVNHDSETNGFGIQISLSHHLLENSVHLKFQDNRKQILSNGNKTAQSEILEIMPLVLFSPESLSAIKHGPEARRELVDEMMSLHNPLCVSLLRNFKKALQSRNRILSDVKRELVPRSQAEPILDALDAQYLNLAFETTRQRLLSLKAIQNYFSESFQKIQNRSVDISVEYVISDENMTDFRDDYVHDAIHKRARELRDAEFSLGTSLVGPHKHDIRFLVNEKDARIFCSQGQQRSLILSFKIAQIMYHKRSQGEYPLLLLDDVFSELDVEKQEYLVDYLDAIDAQIFLTSTDWKTTKFKTGPQVFHLHDGAVLRSKDVSNGSEQGYGERTTSNES